MTNPTFVQFTSLNRQDVNNNSDIRIEITNNSSGDIIIDDDGVISVNKGGVYLISWWFNINDDNVVISLLRESDMEVISSSVAPSKVNTVKGNAIVDLVAGERVIFVNDSGAKKTISPLRTGISINCSIYMIKGRL